MLTNLKLLRMSKQISQGEAAKEVGVSQGWYSLIESGRLQPTESVSKRLSEVFMHPVDELLMAVNVESLVN